ncbi:MAG: hypothetical protein JRJ02_09860 [Deltaproteobacteria bacterium]|nr:hypothetical protein [Deltaproteobacteria bacterium]
MKRKELITVLAGFCFLLTFVFLPLIPISVSAAAEKPITLKFAHQNPPKGRTTVKVIDPYIKMLEKATKGRLKIVSYPAQSLLKAKEVVTGIETGIADMTPGLFYRPVPFNNGHDASVHSPRKRR